MISNIKWLGSELPLNETYDVSHDFVENNVIPSMRKISQVTRLGSTLTPDNTVSINHGKFKSKLKS